MTVTRIDGSYPPFINWKHVDGPMLICSDGTMWWLTWGQRLKMWLGILNIDQLNLIVMTYPYSKMR